MTEYDPTISSLLDLAQVRWENREENRDLLVRWGIPFLDKRLFGINTVDGELILIIGEEKQRKTTLVINTIVNIMTAEKPEVKPHTVIDTLESGMPPGRYTDQLVSNLASRYLMEIDHIPASMGKCQVCGDFCKELRLSPEHLNYLPLSSQQRVAVTKAVAHMKEWPVDIWGAGMNQGDTRNLKNTVGDLDQESRWIWSAENKGSKIFVIDHVQQYRFDDIVNSDYEKLIRAVNSIGSFVAAYKTAVFLVSQISMWSMREAKAGGKAKASGGKKPHEEANVIIKSSYEDNSGQLGVSLEDSRKSGSGFQHLIIDDISGAIVPNKDNNPYE
jgi:hypothetical protein